MDSEVKLLLLSVCEILRETTEAAFEAQSQAQKTPRALLDSKSNDYKELYPMPSLDDSMSANLTRLDALIQQLQ